MAALSPGCKPRIKSLKGSGFDASVEEQGSEFHVGMVLTTTKKVVYRHPLKLLYVYSSDNAGFYIN